jgi:hypothetical protein
MFGISEVGKEQLTNEPSRTFPANDQRTRNGRPATDAIELE